MPEPTTANQHLFQGWCQTNDHKVDAHQLTLLTEDGAGGRAHALARLDGVLRAHYDHPERTTRHIAKWGMTKTAAALNRTLPTLPKARSGDLGEILATEFVDEQLAPFRIPIRRLRWKDGREMAMRGDDLFGVAQEGGGVRFLKGECKSRQTLTPSVIKEARDGLNKNNGLPTEHIASFVSKRLFELNRLDEADVIDEHLLNIGMRQGQMLHLLFTFTGNEATEALKQDLQGCSRIIQQRTVCLRIEDHPEFIKAVYGGGDSA